MTLSSQPPIYVLPIAQPPTFPRRLCFLKGIGENRQNTQVLVFYRDPKCFKITQKVSSYKNDILHVFTSNSEFLL